MDVCSQILDEVFAGDWQAVFVFVSDSLMLGIFQLGFAAVFGWVLSMIFEKPAVPQDPAGWVAVLGLALICSAFGFVLQPIAQKYTTPERTGQLFSLEPVFAAFFGMVFLHEVLTLQNYVGAAAVLVGIYISGRKDSEETSKNPKLRISPSSEDGSQQV